MYLASLLTRLIFVFTLPQYLIWPDETAYFNIAVSLSSGHGFSNNDLLIPLEYLGPTKFVAKDSFFAAPGLPGFLSIIFLLTGKGIWSARLVLVIISSILPFLVFKMCVLLHRNESTAIVAGYL